MIDLTGYKELNNVFGGSEKKKGILEKLKAFFERFFGLV